MFTVTFLQITNLQYMESLEYKNNMIETQSMEQSFNFNIQFDQKDQHTLDAEVQDEFPDDILLQNSGIICYSSRGAHKRNHDKFDFIIKQDYILAAVYDGHGDSTVSIYLRDNLLKNIQNHSKFSQDPSTSILQAIKQIEDQTLDKFQQTSGSTLIVVLWRKDFTIVANVGDGVCYGFLVNQQQGQDKTERQRSKILLNQIHNLDQQNERMLIKKNGGLIFKSKNSYRVAGELNLSRSIGDSKYKSWISANPSIKRYQNAFSQIVIATDGFTKHLQSITSPNQILNLVEGLPYFKDNSTLLYVSKPTHFS